MASKFATKLAKLAEEEYNKYHTYHETTTTMEGRIKKYWDGIGPFPGVGTAWSAVFVSYHVRSAGANATEFKFSPAHSQFVYVAAENAVKNKGVFRAYSPNAYAPKIGDIVHNNRNGNKYDFAYAAANKQYYSHSAIVVEEGVDGSGRYVRTVGGNEGDRIGDNIVRLRSNGLIRQPSSDPTYYISVIQNLK
jgi:hypothetical protein